MIGPGRPIFVLFGSSIVQQCFEVGGWGAVLADLYDRKDAAVNPSLVIVYFGGNDALHPHPSGLGAHVPLPEYIENMEKIYLHLKSLSEKTRLIFLTSPPVNETMIHEHFGNAHDNQDRTNETCHIYAEALVELCRKLDIKVINLWTAVQQREDWATTCFRDGIHFSAEGNKIVAKEILRVIKEADWEPSLYWESMPNEFAEDSPYYMVHPNGKTTNNISSVISRWKMKWMVNGINSKL
ncbi:SGNH hydrolase-type esterase superfamily protein [Striga asiatica]|uniref:SGNH hydrolase-type esterase superfamily protein n=1 Tax=Striga asiatica TaxID=4170 RepID=A0A5A7RF42_STRAF|nr:SGNH hydrolase-type esterase superfamily protein [Striga asiatica]